MHLTLEDPAVGAANILVPPLKRRSHVLGNDNDSAERESFNEAQHVIGGDITGSRSVVASVALPIGNGQALQCRFEVRASIVPVVPDLAAKGSFAIDVQCKAQIALH